MVIDIKKNTGKTCESMKQDLADMDCMAMLRNGNTSGLTPEEQRALALKFRQCQEDYKKLQEETEKVCNKPNGVVIDIRHLEHTESVFIEKLEKTVSKLVIKITEMKKEINILVVK